MSILFFFAINLSDFAPQSPPRSRVAAEKIIAEEMIDSKIAHDAMTKWSNGGDASEAIGTLRLLVDTNPRRASSFAFNLARIVQSEGRTNEAADWYWRSCHKTHGGGMTTNPREGLIYPMTRIVDALEDAGRKEDAAWAITQMKMTSRRELYLKRLEQNNDHPAWHRKWALKLLKDDPKDAEAQKYLDRAERNLKLWVANPEKYRVTRDLPR